MHFNISVDQNLFLPYNVAQAMMSNHETGPDAEITRIFRLHFTVQKRNTNRLNTVKTRRKM
jgi:hypothetical protein